VICMNLLWLNIHPNDLNTMSYCLKCREEFQDWVKLCPDCSLALVDSLPELSKPEPEPESKKEPIKEPLVHVATAPNESVATMWAGILEEEGIDSATMWAGILEEEGIDSFIKGGDWYMGAAIPFAYLGQEIHVLESQAEKAKLILEPLIRDSESTT